MKKGVIFGVFDLFHIGHVRVLQEAKKHCDHLTVCVINDAVAQEYKRKPVINEEQRVEIAKAIRMADEVSLIDFRSPVDFQEIDYYFVSERLIGKDHFYVPPHRLNDVVYLPYSEEINTSQVIKRCQNQ